MFTGKLRGSSASGVGLTCESTLPRPGTGTFELADGERLGVGLAKGPSRDPVGLRAGQVRLIVLPDGDLRGAVGWVPDWPLERHESAFRKLNAN